MLFFQQNLEESRRKAVIFQQNLEEPEPGYIAQLYHVCTQSIKTTYIPPKLHHTVGALHARCYSGVCIDVGLTSPPSSSLTTLIQF